jgi:urea transport system substrate-binding protein
VRSSAEALRALPENARIIHVITLLTNIRRAENPPLDHRSGWVATLPARAEDTIKIGILHSLSGTMAISETTLKDVMLMLIDEQNKKGGLLGKKLEAVVVDPASNWPLFAEKARELISQDKVAVVFGCWTSVSRKSVLPVFKELDSILFYPVQYEGEESERNVFYTGAAPNQQAIPAVD